MPRPERYRVCTTPGCPELVTNSEPCRTHGRPTNASWSTDRDKRAQRYFRINVLRRDGHTCVRCGHHDPTGKTLQAHHVRPGYETSAGKTLCDNCHATVDTHARRTR